MWHLERKRYQGLVCGPVDELGQLTFPENAHISVSLGANVTLQMVELSIARRFIRDSPEKHVLATLLCDAKCG